MSTKEMINQVESVYVELCSRRSKCKEGEDAALLMKLEKACSLAIAFHQSLLEVKTFSPPWAE